MSGTSTEWFESWFESPYYDLLYSKRNTEEASNFIDSLLEKLNIESQSTLLDLACGKGRHSVYLNKKGFDVTGLDLSERSIAYAGQFQNETLKFLIGDMRVSLDLKFNLILNLFTSFGYFDSDLENLKVFKAVKAMLHTDGTFILDYLNGDKIPKDLDCSEITTLSNVEFNVSKKVVNGYVIKQIKIKEGNTVHEFIEKVRLYCFHDFKKMFNASGFRIVEAYGDYNLSPFNEQTSDRIIFFTKLIA